MNTRKVNTTMKNDNTIPLMMVDRVERLNSIIQKQFMSMEMGYVRVIVSTELI